MGFIKPNNNSGGSGGGLTPQELSHLNNAYSHSNSKHAPTTAEENVQADWNETDETSDAYIKNKPTYGADLSLNNNTLKLKNSDGEEIGTGVVLPLGGGGSGDVDLSGLAPIDSPDFTGDISMYRKSGTTVGQYSVALGDNNESSGMASITLGSGNIASQASSIAIGYGLKSLSAFQCVLGKYNIADSEKKYVCIIGNGVLDYDGKKIRSNAFTLDWEGNGWFKGNVSIDGTPTADNHLINKKYVDDAILQATTGGEIDLSGYAKSDNPVFTGTLSMYRKSGTAVGQYSVALGSNVTASGKKSTAFGDGSIASGSASFACGAMCTASGSLSFAEGFYCSATASSSHAEGCLTQALGQQSHSEGNNTIANCNFQHVQGTFNIKDEDGIYAHIVGNGTADNARANIHTVAWDGKGWFKGDVYVGGTSQADGKKLLSTADIYFDTDGNLCVTIGGVTKKFAPIG